MKLLPARLKTDKKRNKFSSRRRRVLLLIIFASMVQGAFADERSEALRLQAAGDIENALLLYSQWIKNNGQSSEAADVLLYSASLYTTAAAALSFLKEHVAIIKTPDRYTVFARMASLETSLGLPRDAAGHYDEASLVGGRIGSQYLLESLSLRYRMGEYDAALVRANQLLNKSDDTQITADAGAIAALAEAGKGNLENALEMALENAERRGEMGSPMPYFALWDIAVLAGRMDIASEAEQNLDETFPDAAATYITQDRVFRWISPADLQRGGTSASTQASVQAGAFGSRDRASTLRSELEAKGFTAWLEQDGDFWKVIVNDADGRVSDRLSAMGYDASIRR